MARSHLDGRWRGTLLGLALAAACALLPAHAERGANRGAIQLDGENQRMNLNAGTMLLDDVTLRDDATVIKAKEMSVSGLEKDYENSRWIFRGTAHVEFNGAVLDADAATVIYVDGELQSIEVDGGPARFSHQVKGSDKRYYGRANTIRYNAASGDVRFNGRTWWSDGVNEANTEALVYNMRNSTLGTEERSRFNLTIRPDKDKKVPAPRTPERSTAQ
jgi:lipopolysaccharide transport protein LptA